MVIPHGGLGILAAGFGLLLALLANVLCYRLLGVVYYEKHSWPKLAVLVVSGIACLVVGLLRKRGTAKIRKPAGNDLDGRIESLQEPAFDGSRDHLFYIPLQYWSIAYFAAAIIYVAKTF
jgi:hypothetical protein